MAISLQKTGFCFFSNQHACVTPVCQDHEVEVTLPLGYAATSISADINKRKDHRARQITME